ncbi:SulA-like leucine-rich domain-containing protein [Streptococcus suis]|uniref:SulA-like leucine-rich domain-containing protein n=1 Tax=Streptococcus suis TaxID=1307 RepID=UPI0038BB4B6D
MLFVLQGCLEFLLCNRLVLISPKDWLRECCLGLLQSLQQQMLWLLKLKEQQGLRRRFIRQQGFSVTVLVNISHKVSLLVSKETRGMWSIH